MRAFSSLVLVTLLGCTGDPADTGTDTDTDTDTDTHSEVDADGDGFTADEDCDDDDASVYPGAEERCNGIDNDCDGVVDNDATDAQTFYADADGDGHGDEAQTIAACAAPSGYIEAAGDCDDASASVHPGAEELCNGIDDNCDGAIDADATDMATWYIDADGDGHGSEDTTEIACDQPSGFAAAADDCDDTAAAVHPGADELCNDIDDDCDGDIDEDAVDRSTFYADVDADGYGDPDTTELACAAPTGFVDSADDCNDLDAATYPGATEQCNGVDNDCDGAIDEPDAEGATAWYTDADEDGYGTGEPTQACSAPAGMVDNADDCDDDAADRNPGATEICDGVDTDCDGVVDDPEIVHGDAGCAAATCLDVLETRDSAPDGVYSIDPDGAGAFDAYCDMTTDGGGWTQIQYVQFGDTEGMRRIYASVFSDVVGGTLGSGSYKIEGGRVLAASGELRYSEPADPAPADSQTVTWAHDFACGVTTDARANLENPGLFNQAPAAVSCTNLGTGLESTNARFLNYQKWSGCWTGPRLWIGSVAAATDYHGNYCPDCIATWKCGDTTDGVFSVPSTATSGAKRGSAAFWVR